MKTRERTACLMEVGTWTEEGTKAMGIIFSHGDGKPVVRDVHHILRLKHAQNAKPGKTSWNRHGCVSTNPANPSRACGELP